MSTATDAPMPDLDLLAIGPHPDDLELFCGGTLAKLVANGHRVGLLDLTRGELATFGTVEERAREAAAAAAILGVARRDNLGLPDGHLDPHDDAQVAALVAHLRAHRPAMVMAPAAVERHPDHAAASALVERAVFLAGVGGYDRDTPRHRVSEVLYYPMRVATAVSFCVDTTAHLETKRRAIACYASQLAPAVPGATLVSDPRSARALEARDAVFGAMIGAEFAEAFLTHAMVHLDDPIAHLRTRPGPPALFPERRP